MSFRGRRPRSSSVSLPYPSVLTKRIRTHATRTHTHIHHAFFAFRWMAARAVIYLAARAVLYPVCLRSLPRMRAPRLDKHGPGMHASERGALVRLSLIIFVICGTFFARTRTVVIVNFSPAALVARVAGKEGGAGARMLQELLAGRDCLLRDRLSEFTTDIYGDTFTGARASARGEG